MMNSTMNPAAPRAALSRIAVLGVTISLVLLAACAGEKRVTSTSTVVKEVTTTALPATTDITIVNLHDEPTSDPSFINIVGTIVNNGDKPVSQLSIRVNAMDVAGQVIDSIVTPPLAQTIPANGGQAQFSARMANNNYVTTYKAIAVAR